MNTEKKDPFLENALHDADTGAVVDQTIQKRFHYLAYANHIWGRIYKHANVNGFALGNSASKLITAIDVDVYRTVISVIVQEEICVLENAIVNGDVV